MKRCPQCHRVETDESLRFCRNDGAPLGPEIDASEVHTSILPNATNTNVNRTTGPTTILPDSPAKSVTKTFRVKLVSAIAAFLVVFAIGGYLINSKLDASANNKTIESVAVLPFENKSGNAESDYLSDGLAESLIYRLSQLSNLKVSPRSSVFRYKGKEIDSEKIGQELGVDAVMSGRLVQRGDDLMISVDLIDVRNKKTLWGEQFERKMSDLLVTQKEIAAIQTNRQTLATWPSSMQHSTKKKHLHGSRRPMQITASI